MKKFSWLCQFALITLLSYFIPFTQTFAQSETKRAPVEVSVKVTVGKADYVQTISICNTSGATIPLTNVEFDFNYSASMPSNIWGNPWVAWKLASQNGAAVVLTGGTPYSPSLPPDPNCTNPLTIQFNSTPSTPVPSGPFVFKAEGGTPSGAGTLTITMPSSPGTNVSTPTVTVTGPNSFSKQQTVTWGGSWQLTSLTAGSYTIAASPVDNGTNFYAAPTVTATVSNNQTTTKAITYSAVQSGSITVTLTGAPNSSEPVIFTGKTYTFTKTLSNGTKITLPADTYTVTASESGYTTSVSPATLVVPTNTTLTVTYTKSQSPSGGPYTTVSGNIVDKNKTPVTFKGVNWFGFNTGNHMLHGLWQSDFSTMLGQIKSLGFNAVRLPFAFDFVLDTSIKPSGITTTCNGKTCNANVPQDSAWNAFQWVVKQFTDNGFFVLLDDHYEDNTYVSNQAQWIQGWQKVATAFVGNPNVGYDLYNEPDSHNLLWDTTGGGTAWATGITNAATAIYAIDPNKLIFVEGTGQGAIYSNWGDGFATDSATVSQGISNPKAFFTQLAGKAYVNQIVVSPHAYGPDGTNGQGPDHSNQTKAYADWSRLNGYLYNNFLSINGTSQSGFCISSNCHIYPIALGEFGGKFDPTDPYYTQDVATLTNLATYLNKLGTGKPAQPSWFYWDWNPNSGNTGGILKDDWATIDCNKVNYLKKYLALQPSAGICS